MHFMHCAHINALIDYQCVVNNSSYFRFNIGFVRIG